MKAKTLILLLILVFASIFAFSTVRYTNHNLERIFRSSSQNAFYLLSFVVDHYLNHEKRAETIYIQQVREAAAAQLKSAQPPTAQIDARGFQGIWLFKEDTSFGTTEYKTAEDDIVNFYQQNLRGKNEHTLLIINGEPFFLVNTTSGPTDILILTKADVISGIRIEEALDSLINSYNLRYFAIVNANNTPILFSTLYENFLPLKGAGQHIITTPEGRILQIEEKAKDNTIVAGFEMESLYRIFRQNDLFLGIIIIFFIVLEGILLANYLRFERFRFKKEKEITQFKEVGALSTGFAHEFRNSLHTITLLAKELDEERRRILLDETNRMKTVMDSLRLLSTKDIGRDEIEIPELINESAALLEHTIKEKNVAVTKEIIENAVVKGNRTLLVTALSNVIKNSIEAHAATIKISTSRKGKKLVIKITDDGMGFDPSTANQIFDPFFSKKGQSGIGLYLAKRIIELHGGEVELARNEHTVFSIIMPV
jgi:signal transduction histidine kinase